MITFISLFAGIGGIDLGLERADMRCVAQVEIDDYCNRVLARHWPHVRRFRDVRLVGAHNLPRADVIAGGFPCQDISNAGKRAGITGERSGLWAEFARIIGELRPRYVLVENVAALLHRGIDRVLGDLAALGFDAEWHCIPAAALGAPHIRDRLFVLAYANGSKRGGRSPKGGVSPTGMTPDGKKRQVDLQHAARMVERQLWPTPVAGDAKGRTVPYQQGGTPLSAAVRMWPTPNVTDWKGSSKPGQRRGQLSETVAGGQLNPTWVEWLMGFPLGWTDLKDSETP